MTVSTIARHRAAPHGFTWRRWSALVFAPLLAVGGLTLVASPGQAIVPVVTATINTIPDQNAYAYPFGVPETDGSTATYGQVITAPAGVTSLDSFTFVMHQPTSIVVRGEVYAWDGAKASGPNLYESAARSTTTTGDEQITFETGGIAVTAGDRYVIFASTSKDYETQTAAYGKWGASSQGGYSGGFWVYLNNGTDESQWTTTTWQGEPNIDLAFKADFSGPASAPPTISATNQTATVGTSFSYTPTVGGSPTPTVSLTGGSVLPTGLLLNHTTGEISGVPAAGTGGVYTVKLKAHNSFNGGTNKTTSFVLTVDEAPGISGTPPTGTANHAYSFAPVLTGFPAPTVSLTAGSLPSGLGLDSATGAITGTPDASAHGSFPITLTASNGVSPDATLAVTITINKDDITGLSPYITGLSQVGQTLTVHAGPVVPSGASLAYVWLADGSPIAGETSSTLKLRNAQAGAHISVQVTASDPDYNPETRTSSSTQYVRERHADPVVTASGSPVRQGKSVSLFYQGLQPGSSYTVTMRRNTVVGSGTADVFGELTINVTIPRTTPVGTQTLSLFGEGSRPILDTQVRVTRG